MKLDKVNGKYPVIMQVLPNLKQGGVERGTVDAARAIIKAGGKAIVVSNGGKLADEIMISKGTHITLPVHTKNPFRMLSNSKKINALIKEYNVDIVHVRSRAPAYSCYRACKKTKAHFVTTFHAAYTVNGIFKRKYNSIMAKGEHVIAISDHVKKYILDNYNIDESKITKVIRGTDMDKFSSNSVNNDKISNIINQWHIPEGNPIVLFPGRLTKWKGQETLISAARILKDRGITDVNYIFLGSDQGRSEYSNMLVNKIAELGLKDSFFLINGTTEMPAAYAISDVVLSLANVPEGFGRVITEAGAMGRPVIATALGGYLETVVDGETGALIEVDNAEELADAIQKYIKLTMRQKTILSNKSIKHVEDNFSTKIMFNKLFGVYNNLLK